MEQINLERLTGIIAFAKAGSLGSFSAAARALSVSPSAVSRTIQRLEQQLGLKLFSRTTRSLHLTGEGQELYERALRLLQEAEGIEQAAAASRSEPAGTLRVTAPLPIGTHLLAPVLPRFLAKYPKVQVDLRLGDSFVNLIDEGIDIALRVGDLADSRLVSRRMGAHRICAFASPGYIAQRGMPVHPNELQQHDCVSFRYQSSGQALRWPFQVGNKIIEVVPNARVTVDMSDALAQVLVAGGGIGMSATYITAPLVQRGLLIPVLHEFAFDRAPVTALWPESRRGNPNVKAFVAFLEDVFPSPAPWDVIVQDAAANFRA